MEQPVSPDLAAPRDANPKPQAEGPRPATAGSPVIEVEGVTKEYRIYDTPARRLLEIFFGGRRKFHDVKRALSDVSFTLEEGRVLGLIGQNGSGKSTLLKILAGILSPTAGRVQVRGRVAAMVDLTSGFNPEFSGLENIFNKCALLGLSRAETEARLEAIIRFSGLGNRIRHPVKTYSSGMLLRLGFSTIIHSDFDVLLVDEVLFVGDEIFSRQCEAMLTHLKRAKQRTIVVTSHSLGQLASFCDELMYLDAGVPVMHGSVESVVSEYMRMCDLRYSRIESPICKDDSLLCTTQTLGRISIRKVEFLDGQGQPLDEFYTGDTLRIRIHYDAQEPVQNPCFRVMFYNSLGTFVHGTNTYRQDLDVGRLEGPGVMELEYPSFTLLEGGYYCNVGIWPDEYKSFVERAPYDAQDFLHVVHVHSRRRDGGGMFHIPNNWRHLKSVP